MKNSTNIKVDGYEGTWYAIDTARWDGGDVYLLESETYGDTVAGLIIDEFGAVLVDDVWNGFDDLDGVYNLNNLTENDMWNILEKWVGVSNETIECVTAIHGYNIDTMEDILYVMTGYNDFEQAQGEYGYDLSDYC